MTNEMYEKAKAIASARDAMKELLDIVSVSECVMLTISSNQYEEVVEAHAQGELLKRFKDVLIEEVSRLEKEFEML